MAPWIPAQLGVVFVAPPVVVGPSFSTAKSLLKPSMVVLLVLFLPNKLFATLKAALLTVLFLSGPTLVPAAIMSTLTVRPHAEGVLGLKSESSLLTPALMVLSALPSPVCFNATHKLVLSTAKFRRGLCIHRTPTTMLYFRTISML